MAGRRGKPRIPPEKLAEMAGEAADATLNVLSGRQVKIEVEMDANEKADLDEYCVHHPELASTPGEALKRMAGLRGYRAMKQMTDPDRKKPSMLAQDAGVPMNIPCSLGESLKKMGMTYAEFLAMSAKLANSLGKKAAKGDETARRALKTLFVKISS